MKQLLQQLNTGVTRLADVPLPSVSGAQVLARSRATVVSAGTERMLVEFGRAGLLKKAQAQPDKVRDVINKVRTDGLATTIEAVRAKLDAPIPLGYCHAGVVEEVGPRVRGIAPGDRVVTNGPHAEYVRVASTLVARIPDAVSDEAAAFAPLAAIGLQGIRLAAPTLGETSVVIGLGLIGLLTVQMLRASGCRVLGVDRDAGRLALAERFGAEPIAADGDVAARVLAATGGVGADSVLLTLASDSDEPVHQAAAMSRQRGRLVLVGVSGLHLRRDDFYRKELTFSVSCSYGPGRYDPVYEEGGVDYPLGFVRWTAQRNFDAALALMADGRLDPMPLVTHTFDFADAPRAYDLITSAEPSLGVVLRYPTTDAQPARAARLVSRSDAPARAGAGVCGIIGAGNFATRTLMPLLRTAGFDVRTIATSGGAQGSVAAEKFDVPRVASDVDAVLEDPAIDTVFVLTRHDTHASLAVRALEAGKHVFVEKPLALRHEDLARLTEAAERSGRLLTVGFNRRFAPLTQEARAVVARRAGPLSLVMLVNAGAIPRSHWTQDPELGGGRITGEACHFVDLARALVGAPITGLRVSTAADRRGAAIDDLAHLLLTFEDGSTAAVHYLASGSKAFPKERIECFTDGTTVVIENWRRIRRYGVPGPLFVRSRAIDKGHAAEVAAWGAAVRSGGPPPIPLDELMEVSAWSIRAGELAATGGGEASA